MTVPVVCKKGKCKYTDEQLNKDWKNDCVDCDLEQQIEHDLDLKAAKKSKK